MSVTSPPAPAPSGTIRTPHVESRLPSVGTTIFTVMSALAQEHGAVNLGQGFPDFDCDPALIDAVDAAMRAGLNQYPPMAGVPILRERIAAKIEALYGHRYDPESEITVTAGATQAILTAVLAFVGPGDEVIVLDPCYDSYAPNVELAGGRTVHVPLVPETFAPDFDRIAAALGPKTRAIIVNSPHNPSGTVWSAARHAPARRAAAADRRRRHQRRGLRAHGVRRRAPERGALARARGAHLRRLELRQDLPRHRLEGRLRGRAGAAQRRVPQGAPVQRLHRQHADAARPRDLPRRSGAPPSLAAFYRAKRDRFRAGLARTKLRLLPCQGTYFQCVDYSAASDLGDDAFCRWLTTEIGVAAIPLSAFYADGFDQRIARFCFAKKDETLDLALARLRSL